MRSPWSSIRFHLRCIVYLRFSHAPKLFLKISANSSEVSFRTTLQKMVHFQANRSRQPEVLVEFYSDRMPNPTEVKLCETSEEFRLVSRQMYQIFKHTSKPFLLSFRATASVCNTFLAPQGWI